MKTTLLDNTDPRVCHTKTLPPAAYQQDRRVCSGFGDGANGDRCVSWLNALGYGMVKCLELVLAGKIPQGMYRNGVRMVKCPRTV